MNVLDEVIDPDELAMTLPNPPVPVQNTLMPPKMAAANSARRARLTKRHNRYKAAIQRACTAADLEEIFRTAVQQAKEGDEHARKCVLEYLMGKPKPIVDIENAGTKMNVQAVIFADNQPRL